VSPWKSVYKIHFMAQGEITFVLTSGGHNAGIVSEPGHPGRSYRIHTHETHDRHVDPDTWLAMASCREGSWWPAWQRWLATHSGARRAPPRLGAPKLGYPALDPAPGRYVHEH
jgi:polyhydroxyalkanoate synthase